MELGFEQTLGATFPDAEPRRARKKAIVVGEGLSAPGVSAVGVAVAGVFRLVWLQPGSQSASNASKEKGHLAAPC